MVKLLHTSDLHLNALKRYPNYLQRAQRMLAQIHSVAVKSKCDIIVVAGDIWQTKNITHEERTLFSDWLGVSPLPTVVISGNHDKRSEEIGDTCLSYLSSLNPIMKRHLVWDGAPTVRDFHGCRFILFPAQGWSNVELDLMLQVLVKYAHETNRRTNPRPIVVVLHEAVYGAKTDTGFAPKTKVKLSEGRFPEVDYWALGDIHKRQQILPNAHYCGGPFQTRFDETVDKGVLVVSLQNPTNPKFKPIKSLRLLQLDTLPDPIPVNAYIQYKPTKIQGKINLPPNVTYHPDVQLFKRRIKKTDATVGIFDGLDDLFVDAGMKFKRRKLAWELVKQMCARADKPLDIAIPKKYRPKSKGTKNA